MNKIVNISKIMALLTLLTGMAHSQSQYLSPTRMGVHPITKEAYVVLSTNQAISKIDTRSETLTGNYPLSFTPSDIDFSKDGKTMYVTEYIAQGKLHALSSSTGKEIRSISVGAYPTTVCINRQGTEAWVTNRFSNDLSIIDLQRGKETERLPMIREPKSMAFSPEGDMVAVGNFLPSQSALETPISACVTLIDAEKKKVLKHISMEDGCQLIEDICFSKDGEWLFVTHLMSRYPFPTTQLERGWMNTNALSIINISQKKHYVTLLLDDMYKGAANPCGMALSENGEKLYVAISGTHELIALSLPPLFEKLMKTTFSDIPHNLTFLTELKERIPLVGKGARFPLIQDHKIFVTDYFSGGLSIIEANCHENKRFLSLGEEPEMDNIRKGELFFSDADLCFQNWQSCVSCHPEARADGVNWDLINDGIGNPKNTKSLLYSHVTPPCMITGIRPNAEYAVRAGIKHIQFATRPEEDATCIDDYLRSLQSLPSPFSQKGEFSKKAKKGERLFIQAGCQDCHNGEYFTDGRKYNVGTGIEEYTTTPFDTPTLKEVWRTAPYLYNGNAKTIKEVLTTFNKKDKHGVTTNMTEKEIEELEAYILSL